MAGAAGAGPAGQEVSRGLEEEPAPEEEEDGGHATVVGDLEPRGEAAGLPGWVTRGRPRCLGAYVRPVAVFLEPRAKPQALEKTLPR